MSLKGLGNLPQWFVPSPKARPFVLQQRIDVTPGANPPTSGAGRFLCFSYTVPKGQALAVKALAFGLWQRVGIADPATETIEPLQNATVAGKVLFRPLVQAQLAIMMENVQNPISTLAAATNTPPQRFGGFTNIADNPEAELLNNWFNPLMGFIVRAEQRLEVEFSIPAALSGNTLQVTDDPAVTARVDFAGAWVAGQVLSDADLMTLQKES